MESINIPIGTSFDNEGVIDAEKAFKRFGSTVNESLKRIGSDKTFGDLGKSVEKAFSEGVRGADALMDRMARTKLQAVKTAEQVDKLRTALFQQQKATDAKRTDLSNVDNIDTRNTLSRYFSEEDKALLKQYDLVKQISEAKGQAATQYERENQAVLEGLELQKQLLGYRKSEEAFAEKMRAWKEKDFKLEMSQRAKEAEFWKEHNLKDAKAMNDKGLAYDTDGNPTQLKKDWEALSSKHLNERLDFTATMPKASAKLNELRESFDSFVNTYIKQITAFDSNFGERSIDEKISTLQRWFYKLNSTRLETGADGTRQLSAQTLQIEEQKRHEAELASAEYERQREATEEMFREVAEGTSEIRGRVHEEEKITAQLQSQEDILDAQNQKMLDMDSMAESKRIPQLTEGQKFSNGLKEVFGWQRIFTMLGNVVQNFGDRLTGLSNKIKGLLLNIGKLGISMMKVFGAEAVKGVVTVGKTISSIKAHIKSMLPSVKQVARFFVKYIFGFRTMYFLVRKVRQAIGEGIKAIAKADNDVNKSISALKTALNQLKGQLGASFAPIIQPICDLLTRVINLATKATVQIGAFLATLTGKHTIKIATAKNVDYAKSLDKTSGSAKKAAKAIKAYLSPLDELNRMDDPNKDNGSGGGGAGVDPNDLGIKYKDVNIDNLGISKFAKKLKEAWKKQDWEGVGKVISDELAKVFNKIGDALSWKKVEEKVGKFTDIVSGIINGISKNKNMWKSLGSAVGEGLNTALKTVNQLMKKIDWSSLGSGIATAIGEAIKKIDPADIAQFIEDKFMVVLELLNGFMDQMKKDGTWTEIAKKLIQGINGVDWYSIAVKTFNFVGNIFGAIRDLFIGFISQSGFSELVDKLASGINDSIAKLTPEDFKQAGTALSSTLTVLFGNIGKLLSSTSGAGKTLLDGIKSFFEGINWESVLKDAGNIATFLVNGLVAIFSTIGDLLNKKDSNGISLAQKIGAYIGNALSKINFKELGSAFGNFGEAILEGIITAIIAAKPVEKLLEFFKGLFASDSPLVKALVLAIPKLGIWGAIISGIGKAIPVALSAYQAGGGNVGSLVGKLFSGKAAAGTAGKAAAGTAGKAGAGKAAAGVAGAGGAASMVTVFGAVASAAVMAGIAIDDYNQKQEAWAWGAEQVKNKNMSLIDVVKGGVASIPEAMGDKWGEAIEGWKWGFGEIKKDWDEKTKGFKKGLDDFGIHLKNLWGEITKGFSDTFGGVGKAFSDFGFHVKKIWGETKTTWNMGIQGIKDALGSIPAKASAAWDGIKKAFAPVGDWFKDKFEKAWEGVKNVFSTGGQIFSGIKEGIEKTFKTVVNKIIDGMNKIIKKPFDKLNDIITTLKSIKIGGIEPFKSFKTISVPQIPKLAQGAVIPASKPFLAMLGDQKSGNNIEAPESLIRQIVREESGNGNGKTTVVAKVGRRELFEIVLEEAKIRQQTTGRNPFEFT